MKLHEFLDSTYVKARQEIGEGEYKADTFAKDKAAQESHTAQLQVLKLVAYVHVLIQFISVKLHLIKTPLKLKNLYKPNWISLLILKRMYLRQSK